MKVCKQCQKALPLSNYYVRKNGILYTMCKVCYNEDKKSRSMSRQHVVVSEKICRNCGVEKTSTEFHKNYSQQGGIASICKDCAYLTNLMTKYKINDIEKLIADRNGKCDICNQPFGRRPYVDHDHACCNTDYTCGKCFRGLLCSGCNMGLGHFNDNAISLSNAAAYVSAFKN